MVARYSQLRCRSVTLHFRVLPIWVSAMTPEELVVGVTARLLKESMGKLKN